MKHKNFDRNFILMVIGQIISILGSSVLRFALDLYVLDITGRADIFATVLAISSIPVILFSPLGGAIADRVNRRNLMVIYDFTSSVVVLALILIFAAGQANVAVVAVIMTLLSIISAMYQPSVQASIPVLVKPDGLAEANGIVSGVGALSSLMGPVLGSLIYGAVGIESLMIISCIAFFLSAVMEIFIQIPFTKMALSQNIIRTIWSDMKEGTTFMIRQKPRIFKTILLAAGLNMFLSAFIVVGVPYIIRVTMAGSDLQYGIAMGAIQLAGIVGALSVGAFAPKMGLHTLYKWLFALAIGILISVPALLPGVLAIGFWPSYILFMAMVLVGMVIATLISVFVMTQIQRETPNELLGKIMAIVMAVSQCAMPVGQFMYGALFEGFSTMVFIPALIAVVFTTFIAIGGKILLKKEPADNAPLKKSRFVGE